MTEASETNPLPKALLWGAAALVGFTMLATLIGRESDVGTTRMPVGNEVQVLDMQVADRPDGSITVHDARTGRAVAVIQPETEGFLRATLRGLAQERMREGLGREAPFRLTRWDNGTLSLEDGATGRRVNLEAFGSTNAQAFAKLLGREEPAR